MKTAKLYLFAFLAMFMLSFSSAWADIAYVKVTADDGTVSWVEINGDINETEIHLFYDWWTSVINAETEGGIDLNEVWSQSGGEGIHYQVTGIGIHAFFGCSNITSITIPSSLTNIETYCVFAGCESLSTIVVNPDNPVYDSRNNCNAIIEKYTNTLVVGCKNTTIPSSVTSIGEWAFAVSGLTSIEIPSSVSNIGYAAFYGCPGLTSIDIPSSVTSIEGEAFNGCSGLTFIDIPSSVISIGERAFWGCSGFTSLTIPSSVLNIGDGAFRNCSGLTSIIVDSSNPIYDSRDNCNAIIKKTNTTNTLIAGCVNTKIPSGVTSIGNGAFAGCSGLTSISIPSGVTSIEDFAFDLCSGLTSITIPSGVTSIGNYAFSNSGLTSITIPSSVINIGNWAFCGCGGLTSLTIPSSVTSIGEYAFSGLNITSLTIPSSVTSIGFAAFAGCSRLYLITSCITDVFETGGAVFDGLPSTACLFVPKGLESIYQSTADWNKLNIITGEIIPVVSMIISCNNKGKIKINDKTEFTSSVEYINVKEGDTNTFEFIPDENSRLEQVLIDDIDVTSSVKDNIITTNICANSKMIVTFAECSPDINGDGNIDISDVVSLVNIILGQ